MADLESSPRVPVFSLGERVRKVREDLGLSQQQLADQIGVDRKTIGNWEGGRNQPRYRDLMMIASVADVSLEWLAGELFRPAHSTTDQKVRGSNPFGRALHRHRRDRRRRPRQTPLRLVDDIAA